MVKRWRGIIDDKAGTYIGKVGHPQMAISVSLAPYRAQSNMSFLAVDLAGSEAGGSLNLSESPFLISPGESEN